VLNTSFKKLGNLCEKVKRLLDVSAVSYTPCYNSGTSDTTGQCAEKLDELKTNIYEELTITLPLYDHIKLIEGYIKHAFAKGDITLLEKNLIDLHYFEGFTHKQIGKIVGYSDRHVSRLIDEAIDKIL
jgi:DNA-directed RNA polymerase specialized sigma subunit